MPRSEHSNISIFIPHIGCPHRCSFCDQRTISGEQELPDGAYVKEVCEKALGEVKSPENTEIAFFGGSFTAIPEGYMTELLEAAQGYLGDGKFSGIRCSTRPDCIDRGILELLKKYGVTAIELGAQSMDNEVLTANERGHTAQDVVNACGLIREYGFELGLQMMIGLYKSNVRKEFQTIDKIIELSPDTVRIYPVVILKGTRLAELYESGEYKPFEFETFGELVSKALVKFYENGINVIKCGLHASEFVEKDMIGGFYHPALREICESRIYAEIMELEIYKDLDIAGQLMKGLTIDDCIKEPRSQYTFLVNPSCVSKAVGHKKSNIEYFKQQGIKIKIIGDDRIPVYHCELRR